jgi:hypothetical protein
VTRTNPRRLSSACIGKGKFVPTLIYEVAVSNKDWRRWLLWSNLHLFRIPGIYQEHLWGGFHLSPLSTQEPPHRMSYLALFPCPWLVPLQIPTSRSTGGTMTLPFPPTIVHATTCGSAYGQTASISLCMFREGDVRHETSNLSIHGVAFVNSVPSQHPRQIHIHFSSYRLAPGSSIYPSDPLPVHPVHFCY